MKAKLDSICILDFRLKGFQIYQLILGLRISPSPPCTHQVPKVAQRVPGQLYDALCEAAVMADEAGEDGGQAVAGSVQHNGGGGSPDCNLGAAALCRATGKKYSVSLCLQFFFISCTCHSNPLKRQCLTQRDT